VKPLDRVFHYRPMPNGAFRVSLARVEPGYEDLAPPLGTGGEDDKSPALLGNCKNWSMLWPKNLLRVEAVGSTPTATPMQGMTTPPTSLLPSSVLLGEGGRSEEGGPTVPVADHVTPMDEDIDDDMEGDDPLRYINTAYDDGAMMSQPYDSGYDLGEHEDQDAEMHDAVPGKKCPWVECKKSLFMQSSQDTSPDATSTQGQQAERRAVLSLTTLGAVVKEGLIGSLPEPRKKHRKRETKKGSATAKASSSQPPPAFRVQDSVPIVNAPLLHVAGTPMLPKDALEAITGDLRRLHDRVLSSELDLLRSEEPGYPLYMVDVPTRRGFVDTSPVDLFFLRFDYIFKMYLMRRLDFMFVRLYALHMNYIIRKEQISQIAVADPYYMHEGFLGNIGVECEATAKYIEDFMVANKAKETILLPYHAM
jgi:hypothetical protein